MSALQHRLSEKIRLQDHVIRIETVDLAAPWQEIERQLLEIVDPLPTQLSGVPQIR